MDKQKRCPECNESIPGGASVCAFCNANLTIYSGQSTGEVSEKTIAKFKQASKQPAMVYPMVGVLAFVGLLGPIWKMISLFTSRPQLNEEGTNYLATGFNAVGIALNALFLLPMLLGILWVAYGVWGQRTWAWGGALFVIGTATLFCLGGYVAMMPLKVTVVVVAIAITAAWAQPSVRNWYGV